MFSFRHGELFSLGRDPGVNADISPYAVMYYPVTPLPLPSAPEMEAFGVAMCVCYKGEWEWVQADAAAKEAIGDYMLDLDLAPNTWYPFVVLDTKILDSLEVISV